MSTFVVIVAAIATIALVISVPPYTKNAMRVGIAIKDGNTAFDTKNSFKLLLDEMNDILKERNLEFKFDTKNIIAAHTLSDLVSKIDRGEIELAGEFSPYLVHQMFENHNMKAIVSPKYFNKENYSSVIFARKDARFLKNNPNDKLGFLVNTLILNDGQKRIMVTGDPNTSTSNSTSGFWYPRKAILERLNIDGKYSFYDIAKLGNEKETIYKVCEGGDIIAGALANFRIYESESSVFKPCPAPNSHVQLVLIEEVKRIPQGAYLLRKELYSDLVEQKSLSQIGIAWTEAVQILYNKHSNSKYLNKKFIGQHWKKLSKDYTYYDEAQKVFSKQDAKLHKREFRQRLSLVIAFIILVIGSLIYLYIKRPHRKIIVN